MMEYTARRGFPTEYGLLGVLLDGPAHGYDIQQRLRLSLGSVWHVAWSQLYNALHGLEEKGWVATAAGESSSGPPRHTYSVTARGRRAFLEWATSPVLRLRDVRVELLAKLHFLQRHAPRELGSLLDRQSDALRRALAQSRSPEGDAWIASIAASFRKYQTESALTWIDEIRRSLKNEGRDAK